MSDTPTTRDYYPAGALTDADVDYVFDNVGFSSASGLYSLPLHDDVRERAEKTLAERNAAEQEQDTFSIYQIKRGDETRDARFEPYDRLQAAGLAVDPANYDLIYTATLTPGTSLEDIFTRFNIDRPADFKGHSLSVSDVVVLRHGDRQEAHYCDDVGFREVPEFLRENPLRTAELSTEQNENMIDGVLNNAPSPGEVAAKEEAGEPPAEQPPQAEAPEQPEAPEQAPVRYYTINEDAARRAKEANSFDDYRPGSATAA